MADYQRIEELLKYLNMSARALSLALRLKNPQIFYDIKAGKCGISKELATKIHECFLNISAAWLLTGEGEMLIAPHEVNEGGQTFNGDIIGNNPRFAGRDMQINPPCTTGLDFRQVFSELKEQRAILRESMAQTAKAMSQVDKAQQHIDSLIELLGRK